MASDTVTEPKYDAVIVPGGGFGEYEGLPPWTIARLEAALTCGETRYYLLLSAGSPHKVSPLDTQGRSLYESKLAAEYLLARGVNASQLLYETSSLDTLGNAYFARTIHIEPLQLKRLHIITSEFHLPRTQAMFELMFDPRWTDSQCQLSFQQTDNRGLSEQAVAARKQKEAQGLASFKAQAAEVSSFADIHQWLFTRHDAYRVGGSIAPLTTAALSSY
ncbi:MAG: YdcF family protein [Pontibacterium sp.]